MTLKTVIQSEFEAPEGFLVAAHKGLIQGLLPMYFLSYCSPYSQSDKANIEIVIEEMGHRENRGLCISGFTVFKLRLEKLTAIFSEVFEVVLINDYTSFKLQHRMSILLINKSASFAKTNSIIC